MIRVDLELAKVSGVIPSRLGIYHTFLTSTFTKTFLLMA